MERRIHALPHAPPRRRVLPEASLGWYALVALALGLIALGVYAYSVQYREGYIVTNLRNPGRGGAAWGLYIAMDVYFVGVSFAGITVAAMCRLFDIKALKPVTRAGARARLTRTLSRAEHERRARPVATQSRSV